MKCTILVGVPGSGKSTWLENQEELEMDDTFIASTDDIIEEVATALYGMTYNEGFKDLIGFAEKVMWRDLKLIAEDGDTVYIDRTNLSAKSRKKFIDFLKPYGYEFECVVFPMPGSDLLPEEEWSRRLDSRPGKTIPNHILSSMIEHYEAPQESEGFSKITFIC